MLICIIIKTGKKEFSLQSAELKNKRRLDILDVNVCLALCTLPVLGVEYKLIPYAWLVIMFWSVCVFLLFKKNIFNFFFPVLLTDQQNQQQNQQGSLFVVLSFLILVSKCYFDPLLAYGIITLTTLSVPESKQ